MRSASLRVHIGLTWAGAALALAGCGDVRLPVVEETAPVQPIAFMHTVHADSFQIPCAYCHSATAVSEEAGIPSVGTCMGCHRFVRGQSPEFQTEIEKLAGFWADSTAIPWVRVHSVPEYVQFPHKPHIRAGVDCAECHGDVAGMETVERVRPLTMGWCLGCHRDRGAPDDCAACHY